MKLFPQISLVLLIAVITLAGTGCGHRESDGHAHEAGEAEATQETEAGVTFSAKKGLHVPPATAKFIDLRGADVAERNINAAF